MDDKKSRIEILKNLKVDQFAKWLSFEFGHCEWCDPEKWEVSDCTDSDCMKCITCWLTEKVIPEEFEKQIEEYIKE